MTTTIKVGFDESQKAVTAHVSIESDDQSPDEVREQAQELYNECKKFSTAQTLSKR